MTEDIQQIKDLMNQLTVLQDKVIQNINSRLSNTPDIEGVHRMSDRVVIVPFSKLNMADWSAEHYNTIAQIDQIKTLIDKKDGDLKKVTVLLRDILDTEKIKVSELYKIRINEPVRQTLTDICAGLEF